MGETCSVLFRPPAPGYPDLVEKVARSLLGLGWRVGSDDWNVVDAEGRSVQISDSGVVGLLLRPGGGILNLVRSEREYLMLSTAEKAGQVAIGSDEAYFGRETGVDEVRSVIRGLALPEDTTVLGDTERRWEAFEEIAVEVPLSTLRLSLFGFTWIDTFTSRQWSVLCQEVPEVEGRLLTRTGDYRVAMLWEDPYVGAGERRELRAAAAAVALAGD